MIVRERIDFVSIRGAAENIAASSHAAYWLSHVGEAEGSLGIQERDITDAFKRIGDLLGFDLVKRDEPVKEAAE